MQPRFIDTVCPSCGTHHDTASSAVSRGLPKDGDATICFDCGETGVFRVDDGGVFELRHPTSEERAAFDSDPQLLLLRLIAEVARRRKARESELRDKPDLGKTGWRV